MDGIVAALASQERSPFSKQSASQQAGGAWVSMWKVAGVPGGASSSPATGAGAATDETTTGAIKFTDPGGANAKYLLALAAGATQRGLLLLVDRLVHTSGLSGTSTSAQTVNSTTLPARDRNGATSGDGVEAWLEIYTALGSTARTATVTYTNQAGTGSRSGSASIPASAAAGRLIPVTLDAGDTGVRSVQSITLSGSTGTAGDFGVTLARRIAHIDIAIANGSSAKNVFDLGMPRLYADSCLAIIGMFDTSTTAAVWADVVMGEG